MHFLPRRFGKGTAAGRYGGLYTSAPVSLNNSIVADNVGPPDMALSNVTGGNNLVDNSVGAWSNNVVLAATETALLSTLGLYGGKTPTHLPLLASKALDSGSTSAASGLTVDQRGMSRSVDRPGGTSVVDIGAVELSPDLASAIGPISGLDINGDSRFDKILFDSGSGVLIGLAAAPVPGGYVPAVLGPAPAQTGVVTTFFMAGDFNGDGRDDLCLILANTGIYWGLSDGASYFFKSASFAQAPVLDTQTMYAGDFDGDGADEIAAWNQTTSQWQVIQFDEATGATTTTNGGAGLSGAVTGLFVGDANRDGRDDLIRRNSATSWSVSLSTSASSVQFATATDWGGWFELGYASGGLDVDAPLDQFLDELEWVYNNVELELYPGFMKGPDATASTRAGNAWDQAGLLEQRLQALSFVGAANVEIATGKVQASVDQMRQWLGLKPSVADAQVLNLVKLGVDSAATQSALTIEFTHAWVRAKAPTSSGLDWVHLDPSWKFKDRQDGISLDGVTDLSGVARTQFGTFDEFEYFALDPRTDRRLPVEFFEDQVMQWLAVNSPGSSLADVAYDGPIIAQAFDAIPTGSAAGTLISTPTSVATYASFAAVAGNATLAAELTHRVRIQLLKGSTEHWIHDLVVPQHSTQSIIVSFAASSAHVTNADSIAPANSSQFYSRLVVGGNVVESASSSESFGSGDTVGLKVFHLSPTRLTPVTTLSTLDPNYAGPSANDRRAVYSERSGEIISVALDANQHSPESLVALQAQLLADVADNVTESQFVPDIDSLLAYAGSKYWFDFNRNNRIVERLTQSVGVVKSFGSGLVKSDAALLGDPDPEGAGDVVIEYLPYAMAPQRFAVDLPLAEHGTIDADNGLSHGEAFQLVGFNSSALEHNIIEEVISSDSISTVKGLQRAYQRDLGLTAAGDVTGSQGNGTDKILVLQSAVVGGSRQVKHLASAYKVAAGSDIENIDASLQNVSQSGLHNLLTNHTAATGLDDDLWSLMTDPSLGSNAVTVFVPVGRSQLGRWENGAWQANNTWLGAVYFAHIDNKSALFAIKADGGSPMSGGVSGETTTAQAADLPTQNFTNFTYAGDPVNVANGNMFRDETDFVFPNLGVPLTFSRHYDAQSKDDFGMGVGWMHSFGDLIYTEADGDRVWLDSTGKRHTLKLSGGSFLPPTDILGDVTYNSGASLGAVDFTFKTRDGIEYRFEKTSLTQSGKTVVGRLDSIVDRNGDGIAVEYDGAGRKITEVVDVHTPSVGGTPGARRLQFYYSVSGQASLISGVMRLDGILSPLAANPWWEFGYAVAASGLPNRLTTARAMQESTPLEAAVTYDYYGSASDPVFATGLIKQITERDGGWHAYEYFANGRTFRVRQGNAGQSTSHAAVETQAFNYNLLRNQTEFVNELGHVETYLHQDNGLLTKQIHADRTRQQFTWGAAGTIEEFLMKSTTDERGAVETFAYFGGGDPAYKHGQLKESTARHYPADPAPLVTRYDYLQPQPTGGDAKPHIVSLASVVVDPDDVATSYVGQKLTTTYSYYSSSPPEPGWYGRLYQTTDPLGGVTTHEYYPSNYSTSTSRGLLRSQARSDREMTFEYDAAGNVTEATTTATTGTLASPTRTYDSRGHIVREVDATGVVTEHKFNVLGRLVETGFGDANATVDPLDQFASTFQYDGVGRVTQSRDALGRVTQFEYDGRGRLRKRINPDGTSLLHEYDKLGNCVAVIDELGRVTRYVYDNRNRRVQTIFADGAVERVRYDSVGNVVAAIDALGADTAFRYDVLGRLLETTQADPDGPDNVDGGPNLTSPITTNKYNKLGQLFETIDPNFNVTQFVYDKLGRVVQSRTLQGVDGTRTSANPAAVGTLVSLATTEFNVHGDAWRSATFDVSQYNAAATATLIANPTAQITTANITANKVHRVELTFDALSRPLVTTNADGTTTQIEYDAAGRVRKTYDELNRVTEFVYDAALGRLQSTIAPDPDGAGTAYVSPVTSYTYDAAGNRIAVTDPRGFTTRVEYDLLNRPAATVDALGHRSRSVFDTAGQPVAAIDALGRSSYTRYDDRGRAEMTRSADPDGAATGMPAIQRFEYDAAGRLVEVVDARGYSTTYTYDLLGRTLTERYVVSEVLDDGDPGFGPVGGDDIPTKSTHAASYDGDYTTMTPAAGTHVAEAQWLFSDLPAGTYRLAVTWHAAAGLGAAVQVRVAVDGGALGNPGGVAYAYNPGVAPDDIVRYDDGVARGWEEAPSVTITGSGAHQLRVVLAPPNDTPLRADAVRLERTVLRSYFYDSNGNAVSEKDALGRETVHRFDELDRPVRTYSPDPDGAGALQPLTTQTNYDGFGNVVRTISGRSPLPTTGDPTPSISDARETARAYDQRNRLTTETVDAGAGGLALATQLQYDSVGNLTQRTELPGHATLQRITTNQYDALDRVTRATFNSDGNDGSTTVNEQVSVNFYDAAGNLVRVEHNPGADPRQIAEEYAYDALGQTIAATDVGLVGTTQRRTTRFTYDAVGNQVSDVDPLSRYTVREYDRLNRLVKSTAPDPDGANIDGGFDVQPAISTYAYDPAGNLVAATNGDNETERSFYDALGQVVRSVDGRGDTTRRRYDAVGNLVKLTDPALNDTTYAYDALDRLTTETNSVGSRQLVYGADGQLSRTIDRQGRVRGFEYDRLWRVANERWYANVAAADAGTATDLLNWNYDVLGRLESSRYDALGGDGVLDTRDIQRYEYDKLDRVTLATNRKSEWGTSGVDAPEISFTFAYSYSGQYLLSQRQEYVAGQFAARTVSYFNPFGELIERDVRHTTTGGTASTILSFENHDSYFTYLADGRIDEFRRMTDWDAGLAGYRNQTQIDYWYDVAGRLGSITSRYRTRTTATWPANITPWRQTTGYDQAHRITQLGQQWDTTLAALSTRPATESLALGYDNAGQLTGADSNQAGQDASYTYGANGNRQSAAEPGGSDSYTTGSQNRVTQDATYSYVYDVDGNLTERRLLSGNVLDQRFTWNHRQQLTKVEVFASGTLAQTIDYRYDAAGGLVRRSATPAGGSATVEHYALSGGQRAITLDNDGDVIRRYVYGPQGQTLFDQVFDAAGNPSSQTEVDLRLPLSDHQHSTRLILGHVANDAVFLRQTVDYAPFGAVSAIRDAAGALTTAALDTAFAHHGSVQDGATGLTLKGARWYSPDLGRFASVDPAEDGANWYAFAGNDPVNFADPTGLSQAGHPLAGGRSGETPTASKTPTGNAGWASVVTQAVLSNGSPLVTLGTMAYQAMPAAKSYASSVYANFSGTYLGFRVDTSLQMAGKQVSSAWTAANSNVISQYSSLTGSNSHAALSREFDAYVDRHFDAIRDEMFSTPEFLRKSEPATNTSSFVPNYLVPPSPMQEWIDIKRMNGIELVNDKVIGRDRPYSDILGPTNNIFEPFVAGLIDTFLPVGTQSHELTFSDGSRAFFIGSPTGGQMMGQALALPGLPALFKRAKSAAAAPTSNAPLVERQVLQRPADVGLDLTAIDTARTWSNTGIDTGYFPATTGAGVVDTGFRPAIVPPNSTPKTSYWWTGRYSTPASQPGTYMASGGRVFPTHRNSGLTGEALRGAQEAFTRVRLLEGHPVQVVRGQAHEAGLAVHGRNAQIADRGAEAAVQRAVQRYENTKGSSGHR